MWDFALNDEVEILVHAVGDSDSHEFWLDLGVAVAMAVQVEIADEFALFLVGRDLEQLFEDFAVLKSIFGVNKSPKESEE